MYFLDIMCFYDAPSYYPHGVAINATIRGSSPSLPANFFFVAGDLQFRSGQNPQKNRQTPNKVRLFFDTMRIAPPSSQFYD